MHIFALWHENDSKRNVALTRRAEHHLYQASSIWAKIAAPLSLAPDREHASAPEKIVRDLSVWRLSRAAQEQYCKGMAQALEAMLQHFPENIYWDLDALCSGVLKSAQRSLRPLDIAIAERFEVVKELMYQFGGESPISFRYVHDFTYGFDWSRWAQRSPGYAEPTTPFNLAFLRYLQQRSYEIVQLISDNDQDYPKLPPGEKRNPFTFSREPEDEKRLYEELARANLIPVPSWYLEVRGSFELNYHAKRREIAEKLGICTKQTQRS